MSVSYYPRPEILAHPGFREGHAVIEASAGTGKTFTLEHLVLDLIIDNRANIEQILVVTFTDAATRELRERIRVLIRKVCEEGLKEKPDDSSDRYWEVNDLTRTRLQEALFRFDGATILTIHGFCRRILSEQAFLGGRLFNQEHVEGQEAFGLAFREEVRRVLAADDRVGKALRSWVEQGNPLYELMDLLYSCHREGCPERLPVTPIWDPPGFLTKIKSLPDEEGLKRDIEKLFADNRYQRNGYIGLVEKLFATLLPTGSPAPDITGPDPAVLIPLFLEWASYKCTINKLRDTRINHMARAAARSDAPESIIKMARILEDTVRLAASETAYFIFELLPRVQKRLKVRKQSLGLIDYDDMLLGVQEALAGENAPVLLDVLRNRWKFALVDEFQDTDPVQWDIFRRIFVKGKTDHHLYIIGDPKQAIYGFRGADVHTYQVAKEQLIGRYQAAFLPLKYNYRSTKEMIAATNSIFGVGVKAGAGFFSGLNSYEEPVECGDLSRIALEKGEGAVPIHLIRLSGEEERLKSGAMRKGLANFIADEIKSLTDPRTGLYTGKGGGPPSLIKLSDIYILTRSGQEGRKIGEVLRQQGIDHAFYKLDGLFTTAEAADILRLLIAIESPQDRAARMAAWLTPFFAIPLSELADWQGIGEHHPLISRLFRWKRLAVNGEWARFFEDILKGSGLIRRLIFLEGERELTNYLHLFELLLAEVHSRPVTLSEMARFLQALIEGRRVPADGEGDMQRLETDKEAVQILTMHKAKGLEAEVIFIAGGFGDPRHDDRAPQIYHRDNQRCLHIGKAVGEIAAAIEQENKEEDQRLAYVALTRARSRLYLPYFGEGAGTTSQKGGAIYRNLGQFYRALQIQLDLLCRRGSPESRLFLLRDISCNLAAPTAAEEGLPPEKWPEDALREPLSTSAPLAAGLRSAHRGVLLTSYTRIKKGGYRSVSLSEEGRGEGWQREEAEWEAGEISLSLETRARPGPAPPESPPALPGGRESGIFIHSLLEETEVATLSKTNFEEWSILPAVEKQFEDCARRHGFSEIYLPAALEMVYRAFRTPIQTENREGGCVLKMGGGIASGKKQQTEMSFVYPIPENDHFLLKDSRPVPIDGDRPPFRVGRGYIQGLIDLAFEHEGKIYLLDWKSDALPAFDRQYMDAHIQEYYNLQAQLYLLAVLRLLNIRSEQGYGSLFGGILYIFTRGIGNAAAADDYTRGVWFSRPSWSRVISAEQDLLNRQKWGGETIKSGDRSGLPPAPNGDENKDQAKEDCI